MSRNFDVTLKMSKRDRFRRNHHSRHDRRSILNYNDSRNEDFQCIHCHYPVSAAYVISGVYHRNHCPYCLHSCHVDLHIAGDRLSACKAEMEPIGLVLKQTQKRYHGAGELMLLHQCSACSAFSINRIAADDDVDALVMVYESSLNLDLRIKAWFKKNDIHVLTKMDKSIIQAQLYGK
jgi:hypothetical protein